MPLLVKFGIDELQTSVEISSLSLGITYRFSKASVDRSLESDK